MNINLFCDDKHIGVSSGDLDIWDKFDEYLKENGVRPKYSNINLGLMRLGLFQKGTYSGYVECASGVRYEFVFSSKSE